jgi:hypothetical protein
VANSKPSGWGPVVNNRRCDITGVEAVYLPQHGGPDESEVPVQRKVLARAVVMTIAAATASWPANFSIRRLRKHGLFRPGKAEAGESAIRLRTHRGSMLIRSRVYLS